MSPDAHILTDYLKMRLPLDLPYEDLVQVCLGIYCHLDGLPNDIAALKLDKDAIADAFAELAAIRGLSLRNSLTAARYGANFHQVAEKGHWIEVIASIFKIGDTVDLEREAVLRMKYLRSIQ